MYSDKIDWTKMYFMNLIATILRKSYDFLTYKKGKLNRPIHIHMKSILSTTASSEVVSYYITSVNKNYKS